MAETRAQQQDIPAIVKRIYQVPGAVNVHSYSINNILNITDLPENFKYAGQEITKTKNGLFLNPLGTGRLYQLKEINNKLAWIRIDSTIFNGYNFGSLFFSIDTTLYSFGGQGLFNHNGNLRHFNELSREWDVSSLSKSLMWVSKRGLFYSMDTSNKELYIEPWPQHHDQALKKRVIPELEKTLWKLDIKTGDWEKLGKFNKASLTVMGETSFGAIVNFDHIVNLKTNKVYTFKKTLSNKIFKSLGTSTKPIELAMSFCIDSTLYVGDLALNYLDSIVISRADLIETTEPFYTQIKEENPLQEREMLLGLVALLGLSSLFLFFQLKKKQRLLEPAQFFTQEVKQVETKEEKEPQVIFKSGKLLDLLNEREKLLLDFIYKHSLDERLTTIEEINKVIGAAQRNADVQKRLRSDLIGTINDKLEIIAESKFNVIDKQRSEFDKRSFEYFIRPEHMQLVEKVLGKKA
jgi:hypothetical protein